jgi:hypothetical protein
MRVKLEDLYEGPRYEKRVKNRRYNKLLNICIVLVFLLILFFTYKLIFDGNDEAATTALEETPVNNEETGVAGESNQEEESTDENTDKTETSESTTEADKIETVTDEEEAITIVQNSEDPNVKETIVSDAWQPVSTEQAEPHIANYDSTSVDWQEMLRALEQATNLTEADWTLWRIGNDGNEHKAKAVVSTKDQKYVYRVYIEWVTSEGWKPAKLETLYQVPTEYKSHGEEESSTEVEESNN